MTMDTEYLPKQYHAFWIVRRGNTDKRRAVNIEDILGLPMDIRFDKFGNFKGIYRQYLKGKVSRITGGMYGFMPRHKESAIKLATILAEQYPTSTFRVSQQHVIIDEVWFFEVARRKALT